MLRHLRPFFIFSTTFTRRYTPTLTLSSALLLSLSLRQKHILSHCVPVCVCSCCSFIALEIHTVEMRMFVTQAGHFGWFLLLGV